MTEHEVRGLLADFIGENKPTMLAKVISVDKNNNTIDVDDDGSKYYGIRLLPTTGNKDGIVLYPEKNSYVLCVQIETSKDEFMVLFSTKYESMTIQCDDISFNEGKNGGLVKVKELEDNLNKIKEYVENLASLAAIAMSPMSALDNGASVTAFNTSWTAAKTSFYIKTWQTKK